MGSLWAVANCQVRLDMRSRAVSQVEFQVPTLRGCPEGVWMMSRASPENVQRTSRGCPEGVQRINNK